MIDTTHDERRDFYRITDTVGLNYSICQSDDIPNEEVFATEIPDEFQLITHLNQIDMESSSLLNKVQDTHPDISRYMKIINAKIEALARHIVSIGIDNDIKPQQVTLSAGGLCFIGNEAIDLDTIIRLSMVLYPTCAGILTYGKIIRCNAIEDTVTPQFDIAIEYTLINETDRDTLVRHVLQLQSNYLRQSK